MTKLSEFRQQKINANKHSQRGRGLLDMSIRRDGYSGEAMVAAADGELFIGSHRMEVSADIFSPDVEPIIVHSDGARPVIVVRDDIPNADDPKAKRLGLSSNRVAELSLTWDADVLKSFDLPDLDGVGFNMGELADLGVVEKQSADAEPQTDRAAELLEKWQVKTGDLWQIGEHRLICGDCTDAAVVARVMGGEKAGACVTDPPYGIGYEYSEHDDASNEDNDLLVRKAFEFAPSVKVWTCGLMNTARELAHYPEAKILCWHKGFAQAGNGLGGASTWEPVLVVGAKNGTLPNDYLSFSTDRIEGLRELHSCPKPVALFHHLIEHLTQGIVYEPFLGSGTNMVACENLGRTCYAIEKDPAYVAVALERMSTAFPALEIKRIDP